MELLLALIALAVAAALGGRGRPLPAAGLAEDLAARVKALEDLVPDQAHIMADVGEHFTNLWFAGRAGNWPLAEFYLNETKSHLRWAVRRIPVRKDNRGQEVKFTPILEAFENSQLTELKGAVDTKDGAAFERAYKERLTVCYSCHKAADKSYLRPRVPDEPATRVMSFDPKAEWRL